jgi:hypothetical protein
LDLLGGEAAGDDVLVVFPALGAFFQSDVREILRSQDDLEFG